mmetsp:Transcript_32685/g.77718  ORF Transcript_32685/g.77718 Transcript_32685/m.77718 type:complete len:481 (+) Transcript_32685:48-1490(+)
MLGRLDRSMALLFVATAIHGGFAAKGGAGSGPGQHHVGDDLAIVQTGVTVNRLRLDASLPSESHNKTTQRQRDLFIDWDLAAVRVRKPHDTARSNQLVMQTDSGKGPSVLPPQDTTNTYSLHARGRICQVLPILVVVLLAFSKLQHLRGASCDVRKMVELLAALSLFLVSGPAVIILNKQIMKQYHFHFPIVLASLGNLLLMVVTRSSVGLGLCRVEAPPMSWGRYARVVLLMNIFNFGSQVCGMWAYLFISVPEIQILKSTTVVLVLAFATLCLREPVSAMLVAAVAVIAGGTVVSALADLGGGEHLVDRRSAEAEGLVLCLLGCALEAGKTVVSQVLMDKLNVFDGLYLSSPAFVLLGIIFVAAMEFRELVHHPFTFQLVFLLFLNAVLTGLIVLSSFWFVKLVGALSLKVVSQARTVALILVSVFFFHEHCSSMQYLGYALTLVGMGIYDHAKTQLAAASKKLEGVQKEAQAEEGKK